MQFLPKDVTTLSTTPSAYKLYLDLKEDDDDQYVLYLWYKEWSDDFDPNNTKASRNQVWSNTFTICPPKGESSSEVSPSSIVGSNRYAKPYLFCEPLLSIISCWEMTIKHLLYTQLCAFIYTKGACVVFSGFGIPL